LKVESGKLKGNHDTARRVKMEAMIFGVIELGCSWDYLDGMVNAKIKQNRFQTPEA